MPARLAIRAVHAVAVICSLIALAASSASAQTIMVQQEPTAAQWWSANGAAVLRAFQNGQCTQWAADRRPDIIRRGVEALVAQEIASGQPQDVGNWMASNWAQMAANAGIPEGHRPRVRAIMVFAPGTLGASSSGHVAYVQRVNRDGSFLVSQMHAPALGRVTRDTLTAGDARLHGVTFIYR
jgi:surface antigen